MGPALRFRQWIEQRVLFSVSLIPETIERTTLGRLELGDKINVEVDSQTLAIVETVERVLADPLMREQFLSSQGPIMSHSEFQHPSGSKMAQRRFHALCGYRSRTQPYP